MIKKVLFSLGAVLLAGTSMAQFCGTDGINNEYKAKFPAVAAEEARLKAEIANQLQYVNIPGTANRGTLDTDALYVPVVVHVMHDYGAEYVSDDQIYTMIKEMNDLFNKENTTALSAVIPPFVPYIGNGHIRFRLATKDPNGNPTHGITRRRTYLTQGGDDQAKMDYWPQNSYLNIWFIDHIGRGASSGIVAAYSFFPFSVTSAPYYDGIIANHQFINNSTGTNNNTIGHEAGHSFFLYHPWNSSGQGVGVACGDDDVDDTPPTKGHFGGCNLYDVNCAVGYVKNNINYPDTTNVQNVMDYADCSVMLTQGQVDRMRATLRSPVGNRSTLISAANLTATGALAARPALAPIADFSVNRVFNCVGSAERFTFVNRSWNDTVTAGDWTFSNGATSATASSIATTSNAFSQPGWVTVSLKATGLHGNNTITKQAVYVADGVSIPAVGYTEDFVAGSAHVSKYPTFDYYNTGRKWEIVNNAGFNDNTSMRYTNKDSRPATAAGSATGTPNGDYSDFFTPAFDLSSNTFANNCFLTFLQAGAYRTAANANDVLEISYSKNCGNVWFKMDSLTGNELSNNRVSVNDYTPTSASEWMARNISIPATARTSATYFRFRFKTGVDGSGRGTGNNYYIDHINIAANTTAVTGIELDKTGMEVAPNPTSGDAFILLKGAGNGVATVMITDITGKNIFQTEKQMTGDVFRINIPASSIYAKGLYLVKVIAGTKTYTRKLVVN